jgi:hypothetical protein
MIITAAILAAVFAGAAGALAYGYRGQRDQEREQVNYLRGQLASSRGDPRANVPAVYDGGRR